MNRVRYLTIAVVMIVALVMPTAALAMDPNPIRMPDMGNCLPNEYLIEAISAWYEADTSVGHSNPFEFMDALSEVIGQFESQVWDSGPVTLNLRPGQNGIVVSDLKGGFASRYGMALLRDRQDVFLPLYNHEDAGPYLARGDGISLPQTVSEGFMIRLCGTFDPARDLYWWGDGEQHTRDGANRAYERQLMILGSTPVYAGSVNVDVMVAATPVTVIDLLNSGGSFDEVVADFVGPGIFEGADTATLLMWGPTISPDTEVWMTVGEDGQPPFVNIAPDGKCPEGSYVVILEDPLDPECDLGYWPQTRDDCPDPN